MTLRMADGPVANLPPGLDAYAGYTDRGGIGITFPGVVARYPNAQHLSITVHGQAPAMCGDVENGALSSWAGYDYGYANASNVGPQILQHGRPRKLWVAHYTNTPHICDSATCWSSSPVAWEADGTQWTDHGGAWDESLLKDDFFTPGGGPMPRSALPASALPILEVNTSNSQPNQWDVVMRGTDGHVYHIWFQLGSGWSGPEDLTEVG